MGKAKSAFKALKAKAEKITSALDNKLKDCAAGLKSCIKKVQNKEAMITKLQQGLTKDKSGEGAMKAACMKKMMALKKDVSQCKADLEDEMNAEKALDGKLAKMKEELSQCKADLGDEKNAETALDGKLAMMKKKLSQCKADLKDEMSAMTQEKGELAKDSAKDKMCMADKKNLKAKLARMMAAFKSYKTEMSNAKHNLKHVVDQLQQCKTLYQPTTNRFVKGQFPRAMWGGYCTCPDGTKYAVSDGNSACAYLMCFGGKAGACHSGGGPWSYAGVSCAPKK